MMTHEERVKIREWLHANGENVTLILKMKDDELKQAYNKWDYQSYNHFMGYMARKYNI